MGGASVNYEDLKTQAHEALEQVDKSRAFVPENFSGSDPDVMELRRYHLEPAQHDVENLARAVLELLEENERLQRLLDAARFRADLPATSHGEDAQ